ncbi:hypothetical protein [Streptomyces sp. NPDC002164]|uniref:hypothetical protein n=1 Tax=Streptomyces sp. NPDC002164 TaxID=3364633 RepID=UPI00368C766B
MLHAECFAAALLDRITDPVVRGLPPIGAVDQFVDSTDVLGHPTSAQEAARATTALRRAADRPGGGPSAPTPPV